MTLLSIFLTYRTKQNMYQHAILSKQSCIRAQCDILKIHENYDDIQYQNLLFKLFLAREKFAFLITEKNFTFFMRTCITFPKIGQIAFIFIMYIVLQAANIYINFKLLLTHKNWFEHLCMENMFEHVRFMCCLNFVQKEVFFSKKRLF